MDFDAIFTAYYTQYRGESQIPASTDDEYTVAMRLANEAINHWKNYEDTFWKELWTTHQTDGGGTQTITTGTSSYTCSSNMQESGGFIRILDSSGNTVRRYPVIDQQDKQSFVDDATYAYFTGDQTGGFTLHLNKSPDSAINGMDIEFDFYKKPTEFSTGTDKTEMSDPYFIVHHILGNRFRASRNWSAYQTAKRDSEDALKTMYLENVSGTFNNPIRRKDNSGSVWGA